MNKLTYQEAMKELEGIIEALQSEQINMDTLSENVKRAGELIEFCKKKLRNIEGDVNDVIEKLQ